MKSFKQIKITWVLLLVLFSVATSAAPSGGKKKNDVTLFRFKDAQGTLVTSHILPPDAAYKGYQIVNYEGDVLETIAPAPTEEEKQQILAKQQQDKFDKELLLRYSTLAELIRAHKRRTEEATAKLSVLNSNHSNIKSQIESEQSKAASYERQGRAIPDIVISNLEKLYGNLERTEDLIQQRSRELEEDAKQNKMELDRYKELKGLK